LEETILEEEYFDPDDPSENGGRGNLAEYLSEEELMEIYNNPETEKKIDEETGEELMKVRGKWIRAFFPSLMEDEAPKKTEIILPLEKTEQFQWEIGKYGRMRLRYLEEYQPDLLNALKARGSLKEHLLDTQNAASERIETMISQMLEKDPPPDKATDQMGWVGHMNMTKMLAESTTIREIVYE
jgi:hypothetical protein